MPEYLNLTKDFLPFLSYFVMQHIISTALFVSVKAELLNLWFYLDKLSFSRTLGYKLNVENAEIIITSVEGIAHAGTGRISRNYSPAVLSFSKAVATAGISHTGGFQREQKQSKCTKVLLYNECYHNLHYSINGDLGGHLIKMSVPQRQNLPVTSLNLN